MDGSKRARSNRGNDALRSHQLQYLPQHYLWIGLCLGWHSSSDQTINHNPATGFLDSGLQSTAQTPPMYYASGTTSNWYSAYFHLNSTNNPTSGVSING